MYFGECMQQGKGAREWIASFLESESYPPTCVCLCAELPPTWARWLLHWCGGRLRTGSQSGEATQTDASRHETISKTIDVLCRDSILDGPWGAQFQALWWEGRCVLLWNCHVRDYFSEISRPRWDSTHQCECEVCTCVCVWCVVCVCVCVCVCASWAAGLTRVWVCPEYSPLSSSNHRIMRWMRRLLLSWSETAVVLSPSWTRPSSVVRWVSTLWDGVSAQGGEGEG